MDHQPFDLRRSFSGLQVTGPEANPADLAEERIVCESYLKLLSGNKTYVQEKLAIDPLFFDRLSKGQSPKYCLIGCADSRVPPDQLTRTEPGEIFIHRNVANLVVNTDINAMSVIQYAVEVLKVKHVIVMGHYGCGGVKAAIETTHHGLIDEWLRNIKDVFRLHRTELEEIQDSEQKFRRLVELNVKEQVMNLCKTSIIQKAWASGDHLQVHGWVYDLKTGIISDMKFEREEWTELEEIYRFNFPGLPTIVPTSPHIGKAHNHHDHA